MDRVEAAGQEQSLPLMGAYSTRIQDLAPFGIVRFRNLSELKTFILFAIFQQLDSLHQRLPFAWDWAISVLESCLISR